MVLSRVRLIRVRLVLVNLNPINDTYIGPKGDDEIFNFPISLRDGLVIDVSFVCEFKGSSRAPGGWNKGVRHSNDVLQARANVKNTGNKYKDVYGLARRLTCHRRYVWSDPR